MKLIKFLVILFLILVISLLFVLGYFGFFPPLSTLMGTNKPRDLGVDFSEQAYRSGLEKAQVEIKNLPATSSETISFEGSHSLTANFTQEELTSNSHWKEEWSNFPIHDLQVRINSDNSCEISGVLELDTMYNFLSDMNINQEAYKEALNKAKVPISDIVFYAKGSGMAKNNTLDVNIASVEFGRLPVPKNIIDEYQDDLVSFAETLITRIPGFSVNEARFENASIYFDGSLPDAELR
jgi:hypothetical protein